MSNDSGDPRLRGLQSISASRVAHLRECPLREVFRSTFRTLLPVSPEARLGTAIHHVLAYSRTRQRSRAELSLALESFVAAEERSMRESGLESHLVPLSRSVAQYFVRTAQAVDRAVLLSRRAPVPRPVEQANAGQSTATRRRVGPEVHVATPDRLVRGTIDLVEAADGGLAVIEFKTGKLTDERGHLKTEFRDQTNLYAALYEQTFGVLPGIARVVSITGESVDWVVDPVACRQLLEAARRELAEINGLAEGLPRPAAESQLARPSPQACRNCSFRPTCSPYLAEVPRGWPWPTDLIGIVEKIRPSKDGTLLVEITVAEQRYTIRSVNPSRARHPELHTNCRSLASFNLRRTGGGITFQDGPLSRFVCVTPSSGT